MSEANIILVFLLFLGSITPLIIVKKGVNGRYLYSLFLMTLLCVFMFMAGNRTTKEKVFAKTPQSDTAGKIISGRPIAVTNLPEGRYVRVEDKCFAFVKRNTSDPFCQETIAVRYHEKIPNYFVIKDIRKYVSGF